LTHTLKIGKEAIETEIIAKTVRAHALSVFVIGIPQSIGIILKVLNIQVFEETVLVAMKEEKTAEFYNNGYNKSQINKNIKFNKKTLRIKVRLNATVVRNWVIMLMSVERASTNHLITEI